MTSVPVPHQHERTLKGGRPGAVFADHAAMRDRILAFNQCRLQFENDAQAFVTEARDLKGAQLGGLQAKLREYATHGAAAEASPAEPSASLCQLARGILQSVDGNPDSLYAAFRERIPVSRYQDLETFFASDLRRFLEAGEIESASLPGLLSWQPTSGSQAVRKWVPYTASFVAELNRAANPWLAQIFRKSLAHVPGGTHYWSLSWLPTALRGQVPSVDELSLFPPELARHLRQLMAVPAEVQYCPSSEDSVFATVCWLAARSSLTFVSVWSPTFWLSKMRCLLAKRHQVAEVLEKGEWTLRNLPLAAPHNPEAAAFLRNFTERESETDSLRELAAGLWPQLSLMSAWSTGTSRQWAEHLQEIHPRAQFEGKGLWATEGVVTIPWGESYVLAYRSHFYEFEDVETGDVIPSWEVHRGRIYRPVITAANAFLRYRFSDRVRVEGFDDGLPLLEFLGREGVVDLVGEKLDHFMVTELLAELEEDLRSYGVLLRLFGLLGVPGQAAGRSTSLPHYVLLCETPLEPRAASHLQGSMERSLLRMHHYALARELGQLGPVRVLHSPLVGRLADDLTASRSIVPGSRKVESVELWTALGSPEERLRKLENEERWS